LAIKEASVDLIVSSPPYIGMIDYALANRLIYLWMGWKLDDDKYFEIGSRSKRKRKNALNEYLSDMNTAINQMAMVLKPGGFCAIILGESRKFAGATEAILKIFEEHMIKIWGPIQRTPIRRRISERAGTQQGESICVFQKAQ
jgi:DNA modification methylase